MKYLFLYLFLLSCSSSPGQFNAEVVREYTYRPLATELKVVVVYSAKYGKISIDNSPFYESLRIGQIVVVGCTNIKGLFAFEDCVILGKP
jgi:hypothetical protein